MALQVEGLDTNGLFIEGTTNEISVPTRGKSQHIPHAHAVSSFNS
jgi:hypothetical protein